MLCCQKPRRCVASISRVGFERQTDFLKTRRTPANGAVLDVALREESVDEQVGGRIRASTSTDTVLPISLLPRPSTAIECFFAGIGREQCFFGRAAGMPERNLRLHHGSSFVPFSANSSEIAIRAGQIHVVAADQQVGSRRQADGSDELARLLPPRRSTWKIGRAAADVADEQRVADFGSCLRPAMDLVEGQPGVQRRLRFFEQDQRLRQTGRERRFARQLAGTCIKRRGNREHNMLFGDRRIRNGCVPGGDQMFEIAL